jgi:hypothetical protein
MISLTLCDAASRLVEKLLHRLRELTGCTARSVASHRPQLATPLSPLAPALQCSTGTCIAVQYGAPQVSKSIGPSAFNATVSTVRGTVTRQRARRASYYYTPM